MDWWSAPLPTECKWNYAFMTKTKEDLFFKSGTWMCRIPWASRRRRRTAAGWKQGRTCPFCDPWIPSQASEIVGQSRRKQKKSKLLLWLPAQILKKEAEIKSVLQFILYKFFYKPGKLWLYFKSKADKSSSFCLVIPFQLLTVPECRPEGCLSNHSGTRGCTWLYNYSAPALIKACYTFRNIVSYAECADILGQQMAHWGFKGTFSHFSLPRCANKTTHVHQQPQSDVIPHSTLLSRSGRQVWEPGQRHPVLVEVRVQRLKKFQLVRCHKSCTKIRQSAEWPLCWRLKTKLTRLVRPGSLSSGTPCL